MEIVGSEIGRIALNLRHLLLCYNITWKCQYNARVVNMHSHKHKYHVEMHGKCTNGIPFGKTCIKQESFACVWTWSFIWYSVRFVRASMEWILAKIFRCSSFTPTKCTNPFETTIATQNCMESRIFCVCAHGTEISSHYILSI